jgi:predicted nucleic acid-binding protein
VITLDTSAVVALTLRGDPNHVAAVTALMAGRHPVVVPAAILAEIDRELRTRSGDRSCIPLLEGIQRGDTFLDCGDRDLPRILELLVGHPELSLPFARAAVAVCAERTGGSVLTFDRRALGGLARHIPITLVP